MEHSFIGIDYSLNSPSVAIITGSETTLVGFNQLKRTQGRREERSGITCVLVDKPKWATQQERYHAIAHELLRHIPENSISLFESYAFGMSGQLSRVFDLAEGTQTLKSFIYRERSEKILTATPGELKKFATGKGNAGKLAMIDAFKKKYDFTPGDLFGEIETAHPFEDMIDAYWAARYCEKTCQT